MKHLYPLFLILISLNSYSQSFVQDNKQWNVIIEAWGVGGISHFTEVFCTSGDTLLNENNYSKLYRSDDSLSSLQYQGALREENNQVFFINTEGVEGLLYDFSLSIDDTTYVIAIDNGYGNDSLMVIVDSIDFVNIENIERKRLWIHNDEINPGFEEFWIEGIGSNNGPLYTFIHCYWVCPLWQLSCCFEDGIQIYQNEYLDCYANDVGIEEIENNLALISPNPLKRENLLKIQMNDNIRISFIECFDLSGNKVLSEQIGYSTHQTLDLSDLAKGSYILKISTSKNQEFVRKLIIQ